MSKPCLGIVGGWNGIPGVACRLSSGHVGDCQPPRRSQPLPGERRIEAWGA